jgi:hypothetical protein
MLSKRLVNLIEEHAEGLMQVVLDDLVRNPRTVALQNAPHEELKRRIYDIFHKLGRWLADRTEDAIERTYAEMGRKRLPIGV